MIGLADYVALTPCPYPPIVAEWESIPQSQVLSFVPEGFARGSCFGCQGPGLGMFESGMDWTQWGVAEWITVAAGAYFAFSLISDVGRGASKVRRTVRSSRARAAKRARLKRELEEA